MRLDAAEFACLDQLGDDRPVLTAVGPASGIQTRVSDLKGRPSLVARRWQEKKADDLARLGDIGLPTCDAGRDVADGPRSRAMASSNDDSGHHAALATMNFTLFTLTLYFSAAITAAFALLWGRMSFQRSLSV